MKVKRAVVAKIYAEDIASIYSGDQATRLTVARRPDAPATRQEGLQAGRTRAVQVQSRAIHARPAAPMVRARSGSASRSTRAAVRARSSRPGDDVAGVAVLHGLRRTTGVAGDDGKARRRRLEQHDAEPLDVEPTPAGAARQREHVADGVVGRRARPPAPHRRTPRARRPPARRRAGAAGCRPGRRRPAATGLRAPVPAPAAQSADERVLTLAGDQPGHACDHRGVAEAVAAAQLGPCRRVGPERARCRRRAAGARGRRRGRRRQPPVRGCSARSR